MDKDILSTKQIIELDLNGWNIEAPTVPINEEMEQLEECNSNFAKTRGKIKQEKCYRDYSKTYPNNIGIAMVYIEHLIRIGKIEEANKQARRFISQGNRATEIMDLLTYTEIKLKNYDNAFNLANMTKRLDKDNICSRNYIAYLQLLKGRIKEAELELKEAREIYNENTEADQRMYVIYSHARASETLTKLEKAVAEQKQVDDKDILI